MQAAPGEPPQPGRDGRRPGALQHVGAGRSGRRAAAGRQQGRGRRAVLRIVGAGAEHMQKYAGVGGVGVVAVLTPAGGAAVQLDVAAPCAAVGVEQDRVAEVGPGGAVPAPGEADSQRRAELFASLPGARLAGLRGALLVTLRIARFEAQPGARPAALGPAPLQGQFAAQLRGGRLSRRVSVRARHARSLPRPLPRPLPRLLPRRCCGR